MVDLEQPPRYLRSAQKFWIPDAWYLLYHVTKFTLVLPYPWEPQEAGIESMADQWPMLDTLVISRRDDRVLLRGVSWDWIPLLLKHFPGLRSLNICLRNPKRGLPLLEVRQFSALVSGWIDWERLEGTYDNAARDWLRPVLSPTAFENLVA